MLGCFCKKNSDKSIEIKEISVFLFWLIEFISYLVFTYHCINLGMHLFYNMQLLAMQFQGRSKTSIKNYFCMIIVHKHKHANS